MKKQINELPEGSVVIITDKVSDRVRESDSDIIIGTLVKTEDKQSWVLLSNGNIWVGDSWKVYIYEEYYERPTNLRQKSDTEDSVN
jgi:hypothetical protein